jgi:hypothetical protein
MKKINATKPMEIDGMLYQKTNEDFNKEKPNPLDPVQIKVIQNTQGMEIKPLKKGNKNES